jgi:phosphatidyl-myo-inositol dimannoside synthase
MILVLTQCFPPETGGIENLVGGLAQALGESGRQVLVMADATDGDRAFEANLEGVSVQRNGGPKPLRRRLKAWAAARLVAKGGVEAVFCDSWKSLELFAPGSIPVAAMAHGTEFPPAASQGKRRRIALAFRKATAVIANSRYTADLARQYLSPPTRLAVVHPPIRPQPAPNGANLERLSALTRGERPLLVGLARLEPRKGFDRVIQSLPSLARRFPGIRLAIGGGGGDAGRLEELAREAGVGDRLHLLGRIDDDEKAALFASGDLFVMPTRREGSSVEGFGIAYVEAAWYGVPALAGSDGGGSDAVVDGETGRVVEGESREAVEAAIGDLLADEPRRKAMGEAARARVVREGTWQTGLACYLDATLRT